LQHLEKGLAKLAPDFHSADGALQCHRPHGGVTIWTGGGKVLWTHVRIILWREIKGNEKMGENDVLSHNNSDWGYEVPKSS